MKIIPRWTMLVTLAFLFIFLFQNTVSASSTRFAIADEVVGTVMVTKAGGSKQIRVFKGMGLNEGDTIKVSKGSSLTLHIADQVDQIVLGENWQGTLSKLRVSQGGKKTTIKMWAGSMFSKVKKATGSSDEYKVETPTAVMGVRGTHFSVVANPDTGSVTTYVHSGSVTVGKTESEASDPNKQVVLLPAQQLEAYSKDINQDLSVGISYVNLEQLAETADVKVLTSILLNKVNIDRENEEQLDQLTTTFGTTQNNVLNLTTEQNKQAYIENVEKKLFVLLETMATQNIMPVAELEEVIAKANETIAADERQYDLTRDVTPMNPNAGVDLQKQQELEQKKLELEKQLEQQRQAEEAARKKLEAENAALMERLREEQRKQEEANVKATEEKKKLAEQEYLAQLATEQKAKFEAEQKQKQLELEQQREEQRKKMESMQINTTPTVATTTPVVPVVVPTPEPVLAPLSSNADLSGLVLSSGNISSLLASGNIEFKLNVANAVSSITITPTVEDSTAAVRVNNLLVASGSTSTPVNLNVGTNTITVVVTAQDGRTTKTYTIAVTRDIPTKVTISTVIGATLPVTGAMPVATITDNVQYTGEVSWTPSVVSTFAPATVYSATITLTPKAGFTLTGVSSNFFTVAGATSVSNSANSGVITAVFPATQASVINLAAIQGVSKPETNGTPVTSVTATSQYTGSVAWSPTVSTTFAPGTTYTATITLTPKSGYTLSGVSANFFTVTQASSVTHAANSGMITAVFPATLADQPTVTQTMKIEKIAAGGFHNLALESSGKLWAWGNNNAGQVGDGTILAKKIPIAIGSDKTWKEITTGHIHSAAITGSGELWAWGANSSGLLGDGTNTNRSSPVRIGTATNWRMVSAGSYHTVAINTEGELWAWGKNDYGQLGDGTNTNRTSPFRIGTATNWKMVDAGQSHTLAINEIGELWAWGYNGLGQLGDNTYTNRTSPVRIGTATNWNVVDAGNVSSLAIRNNGELWAWGGNYYGQLGRGIPNVYGPKEPTQVGTDGDWQQISISREHSVAIKGSGQLWSWGRLVQSAPVQVGSLSNWSQVLAGGIENITGYHSLALNQSGEVWTWGSNAQGQLGNGTNFNSAEPIQITEVVAEDSPINISAIAGVTRPSPGDPPVITITETSQYTGTVTWSPSVSGSFASGTTYAATITLTPKSGYTLDGVDANFFTVDGATIVSNDANSGVITAVFPIEIMHGMITGIEIPETGGTPSNNNIETDEYNGTVTWLPEFENNKFAPGTTYRAVITLIANQGYIFTNLPSDFFNVEGAITTPIFTYEEEFAVIIAEFPVTANLVVTETGISGVAIPVTGATPVTSITANDQYTGTVTWSPSVNGSFAPGTTYTATITLTPKSGYTLDGVDANFFTVDGATSVSNNADSGVITVVFPVTGALTTVNLLNVADVTIPETGELDVSSIDTQQYTGTITWNSGVVNTFAPATIYSATITLTPKPGYTLTGVTSNFFKVAGGSATNSANSGTITVVFPRTVNMVTVPAGSITKAPIWTDNNFYSINISHYMISDTEVTYGLWYTVRQWAMSNGYTFTSEQGREGHNGTNGAAPTSNALNEPVTDISWRDIIVWLNAYSQKEGLTPVYRNANGVILKDATQGGTVDAAVQSANNGYRLPTKAEWAIAARWLGTTAPNQGSLASARITSTEGATTYYWLPENYAVGSTESTANDDAIKLVAWFNQNSGNSTKTVATRLANVLGLYDMSGNVDELLYDINTNPSNRIITGGSYDDDKDRLTPDDMFLSRSDESSEIGFRFVRTYNNEPPMNIALSSTSVAENAAANTVVGTLTATDPDPNSTFTFTLVSGTGDTDNASFNISGNQLRINAPFDYETKNSYSIRIRVTDNGTPDLTYEKTFTITVTDVDEG